MVNVNTVLPFNLHNKDVPGRRVDPSSSRSTRSRSAHPTMGGPSGYGPEMLPEVPSRMASYSPTRDRDPSPPLEVGQSITSLHPGDASYLPEGEDDNGNRRPILNVRLVKEGEDTERESRSGRSTTRGRPGFSDPSAVPEGEQEPNGSAQMVSPQSDNARTPTDIPSNRQSSSTLHPSDFKIESVGNITCSWGD